MNITLDQYVINAIKNYPILYHSKSYFQSKMKVLDYLLNNIGNGICDDNDLEEHLAYVDTSLTINDIESYITGAQLFNGYTKVKIIKGGTTNNVFEFPCLDSCAANGVTEADKASYKDVVYWSKSRYHEHSLYPNFSEAYSLVYQCPSFMELDKSFIEGALGFYNYCFEFFKTKESLYLHAFPRSTEKESADCSKRFANVLKNYESYEEITESYGVPYTGDIYEFQVKLWELEKYRIINFVNSTIKVLEDKLFTNG